MGKTTRGSNDLVGGNRLGALNDVLDQQSATTYARPWAAVKPAGGIDRALAARPPGGGRVGYQDHRSPVGLRFRLRRHSIPHSRANFCQTLDAEFGAQMFCMMASSVQTDAQLSRNRWERHPALNQPRNLDLALRKKEPPFELIIQKRTQTETLECHEHHVFWRKEWSAEIAGVEAIVAPGGTELAPSWTRHRVVRLPCELGAKECGCSRARSYQLAFQARSFGFRCQGPPQERRLVKHLPGRIDYQHALWEAIHKFRQETPIRPVLPHRVDSRFEGRKEELQKRQPSLPERRRTFTLMIDPQARNRSVAWISVTMHVAFRRPFGRFQSL
jgi:hypothetical protein